MPLPVPDYTNKKLGESDPQHHKDHDNVRNQVDALSIAGRVQEIPHLNHLYSPLGLWGGSPAYGTWYDMGILENKNATENGSMVRFGHADGTTDMSDFWGAPYGVRATSDASYYDTYTLTDITGAFTAFVVITPITAQADAEFFAFYGDENSPILKLWTPGGKGASWYLGWRVDDTNHQEAAIDMGASNGAYASYVAAISSDAASSSFDFAIIQYGGTYPRDATAVSGTHAVAAAVTESSPSIGIGWGWNVGSADATHYAGIHAVGICNDFHPAAQLEQEVWAFADMCPWGVENMPGTLNVNSESATTLGSVTKKIEVFDEMGVSLGFIPVYDSIT